MYFPLHPLWFLLPPCVAFMAVNFYCFQIGDAIRASHSQQRPIEHYKRILRHNTRISMTCISSMREFISHRFGLFTNFWMLMQPVLLFWSVTIRGNFLSTLKSSFPSIKTQVWPKAQRWIILIEAASSKEFDSIFQFSWQEKVRVAGEVSEKFEFVPNSKTNI